MYFSTSWLLWIFLKWNFSLCAIPAGELFLWDHTAPYGPRRPINGPRRPPMAPQWPSTAPDGPWRLRWPWWVFTYFQSKNDILISFFWLKKYLKKMRIKYIHWKSWINNYRSRNQNCLYLLGNKLFMSHFDDSTLNRNSSLKSCPILFGLFLKFSS